MSEERQLHLLSSYRLATSYPLQQTPDEVAAWLNGYAALWHPVALAGATQAPQASSSYDHDYPRTGFVYCIPEGAQLFQPDNWSDRVAEAKAVVFRATASRADTVEQLLGALREAGQTGPLFDAPAEAVRLFAGLGYGYQMLDTLYEAMDHEKLLDGPGFWADVAAARDALARGEDYLIHLRAAAEKLQAGREPVYSGSLYWLDWVHLDPKNLNAQWPTSLLAGLPITLLASGETLERLAEQAPDRFAELKAKLPPDLPQAVDLCVGSYRDREDALMPAESQLWNLRAARKAARALFGVEPAVYGRKKSAYHPQLPGWLLHAGFKHAVLISSDGGLIPSIRSSAVNWPGPDGKAVEAFTREPLPAHDPHTFFNLVYHLHQATTYDSAPTVSLVHKGEPAFASYADLLALADLAPVFGEWTNLSRYFGGATSGDYIGVQSADEFFADYLDERVTNERRSDPVGGFPKHLRARRRIDSAFTLAALHRALTPPTAEDEASLKRLEAVEDAIELAGVNEEPTPPAPLPEGKGEIEPSRLDNVFGAQDAKRERPPHPFREGGPGGGLSSLAELESHWAQKLADRIQVRSAAGQPGLMVFNPCAYTRRVALEVDGFRGAIPVTDPVKAAEFSGGVARLVVEVPPLGFAWVPRAGNAAPPKPRIKLADGLTVRNEFIECDLDATTGGIRSFRDLRTRATRFGQQLVFNPGSKMVARDIRVTNSGAALGEIVTVGDLVSERDEVLAGFTQRVRAWLGRPVLELRIELDVRHQPSGYPWHAFYGARFGWRDDRAVLFRGVNGANTQTGYTRPVSPDYLEVRLGAERSFLFTGGLPFVQRHGSRMADVILVPEGERARTFDLLLATDREWPMQTAQGWVSPTPVVPTEKGPPAVGTSGWLGHVDIPSLLLLSLRPCPAGEGGGRAVAGTFVETAGFGGAADLRFARDPSAAALVDAAGNVLQPLTLNGDAVPLEYSAGETFRVRAEWA
ncbi:hypothetical protein GobsT_09220 [Gemmata obscuriglobus]|uniref:Glycoside hydrolase family 38 N-terminal domain-containing protein n=1 Tax=Gemmata obscuriglobus TaxID=114 RepID=A0A2Z3H833_9BACT|nr:hypothetical protein [Gemmata obscuriglobus]AWM40562.1 hypothetical protein C1280_28650 [Gemmata obscuriglobus]QEG26183.1 hypothetical protein GobsT_09220 [Gemmata obscuriglobus]